MTANADTQALLEDPVAVELLASTVPARLAYTLVRRDTARGAHLVPLGRCRPHPGLPDQGTEDPRRWRRTRRWPSPSTPATFPYHALFLRGSAEVTRVDDVTDEYASSAERYFGPEQGRAWVDSLRGKPMARIRIVPTWVNILDFETRFPSALSA